MILRNHVELMIAIITVGVHSIGINEIIAEQIMQGHMCNYDIFYLKLKIKQLNIYLMYTHIYLTAYINNFILNS